MIDGWLHDLLGTLRQELEELYGERLVAVYLFGSYARGEADAESDVDVLVVLDEVRHYYGEIRRTGGLVSELALRYEVSINMLFLPEPDWRERESPFLLGVREDALAA